MSHKALLWLSIALCTALLLPGASGPAVAGDTGQIEVLVQASGKALAGARVEMRGPKNETKTTGADGKALFAGLDAGSYTFAVHAAGYQTVKRTLALARGATLKLAINLQPVATPVKEEEARPSAKPQDVAPAAEAQPSRAAAATLSVRDSSAPPPPMMKRERKAKMAPPRSGAPMGRMAPITPAAAAPGKRPAGPLAVRDEVAGSTEHYVDHGVRQWEYADKDNLSTFAADVDTASYTIARRKLREGQLPPTGAVRTEEFVNYFRYNYPAPKKAAFAVSLESAPSPFEKGLTVLRVGIKGQEAVGKARKPVHLTFLVDTSGSMHSADKLELAKRALRFLVDQLKNGDTVALCTYAGSVREVLRPTGMDRRAEIHEAIESLSAGGSTAMASGLELAYRLAAVNKRAGAENRVIVLSDGDANVGRTSHGDMLTSIAKYAAEGITLSTIGLGMGNYKDNRMEQLANKGNGNYYYIDSFSQAKRVFGEQLMGTLQVIAKDVKIQVEFDKQAVRKYRLVGYENRDVADEDFRNDKVDAGEIGAGHTVTALYEVEVVDPSKVWATVRIRWKKPDGDKADERAFPLQATDLRPSFEAAGDDFQRAVAAAALAENLRRSPFAESWTIAKAKELAQKALARESPEELELLELIDKTAVLMGKR